MSGQEQDRGPAPDPGRARSVAELSPAEQRRVVALTAVRCTVSVLVIGLLYFKLPGHGSTFGGEVLVRLAVGVVLFFLVIRGEVRRIGGSRLPEVDAVESLILAATVFLFIFASCYASLSKVDPTAFSQPLDRTGALYFAITTFGTVGYGDIAAHSHLARMLVSAQILLDVAFLAVMIRLLFGVSRRALTTRG